MKEAGENCRSQKVTRTNIEFEVKVCSHHLVNESSFDPLTKLFTSMEQKQMCGPLAPKAAPARRKKGKHFLAKNVSQAP